MKQNQFVKKLNTCLSLLVFAATVPFTSTAQNQQTITLDQAIQMGIASSNKLKNSQGVLDYAESKHHETYDLQYPVTKLSATYSRLSDVPEFSVLFPGASEPETLFPVYLNSYQNHISLNEIIFAGFRVKTAKEAADKNLGAAQYDLQKDKDDVKLNIITAYYNLYKVQQAVDVIAENLVLVAQRLKDVQNLEQNGMATHNDALRIELQQSNIDLTKLDADNILKQASFDFNLLIDLPGDANVVLDTASLFTAKAVVNKDVFISNALQNRPEVQSLLLRNEAAQDNVKIARNGYWPTVSAGANYYYGSPNQRYIPPTDAFHTTWDIGLTLNWDITNMFTNKHQIAENKALLDQSNAQRLLLSDGIKSEVNQNYLAYSQALQKVDILTRSVSIAEENMKVTDSRYKNNVALVSDLTDAQTQQILAQINLVIARADAQITFYKLQKSTGNF